MLRALAGRVLLASLGLALALSAVEAYLQATVTDIGLYDTRSPAESQRWISHPFLPFAGKPNGVQELTSGEERQVERIATNSYGFRAHEFPSSKGPDDYVVLAFGGSTTYGYRVESNSLTWPELLEAKLGQRYPERRVRVFNLGSDLGTTAMSLVNLALVGLHLQPDLVVVYHAYNDLSSLGYQRHRTDYVHFYDDLPPTVWRGFQSQLPDWLAGWYTPFVMAGLLDQRIGINDLARNVMFPRDDHPDRMNGLETVLENFRNLYRVARGQGAQVLFATFQFRDGPVGAAGKMNEALLQLFEDEGYPYVDQDALIPDNDPSINVDPCHFTQTGREMMADNFFEYIVAQRWLERIPN